MNKQIQNNSLFVEDFIKNSNLIENKPGIADPASMNALEFLLEFDYLTPERIEKAHGLLMSNKRLAVKYKGKFRDCSVCIGGNLRDNQIAIPNEIRKWCKKERNSDFFREFLLLHFEFEMIHPFADGNGRIGRLLFLYRLLKNKLRKVYFSNNHKSFYYKEFEGVSSLNQSFYLQHL